MSEPSEVFDTPLEDPELLEMILLRLPMYHLLFAQKVCRGWHVAINSFKSIRQALFLEPGVVVDAPCEARLERVGIVSESHAISLVRVQDEHTQG